MKHIPYIAAIALFFTFSATSVQAQIANYRAYSIFLYNFTKYTHWPDKAASEAFVISVVGKSKVTEELQSMAEKKSLNGRKFVIHQVQEITELPTSHLVFVTAGKSGALDELVTAMTGAPTLIVTERDGLIRKGAHISFLTLENEALRFEVNTDALALQGLQMAKNLLALSYQE